MDTNSKQEAGQRGGETLTLDINAILAGSSLMRMIEEGDVSRDVLSTPVHLIGLGDISVGPMLKAA